MYLRVLNFPLILIVTVCGDRPKTHMEGVFPLARKHQEGTINLSQI